MVTPTSIRHTEDGSFGPAAHMEFVKNKERIDAFKRAFEKHAPGKTVMDVGTGSGILAIHALRAGAKRVVAVEKDARMMEIAKANFKRNGFSDSIEIIDADALTLTSIPKVDIICGELLSTWGAVEPQVQAIRHLLNISINEPLVVPIAIINKVQGVHATFGDIEGLVQINEAYFEFSNTEKAEGFTDEIVASHTRFYREMPTEVSISVRLRMERTGHINALRLSSMAETTDGIFIPQSDDTNPPIVFPLAKGIDMKEGQETELKITYRYGGGWDGFNVKLEGIGR